MMAKKKQASTSPPIPSAPSSSAKLKTAVFEGKSAKPGLTAPDGSPISRRGPTEPLIYNNNVHKAAQMIVLAALYGPVSELSLSPVYGTAQASIYHRYGALATALAAFLSLTFLQGYIPKTVADFIPALAASIPIVQFQIFKYSSSLPVPFGPLITELVTYFPLLFLSIYTAGLYFSQVDLSSYNQTIAEQVPSASAYVLYTVVRRAFKDFIPRYMGSNIIFTRVGLQAVIAGLYALALPSAILWPTLPALGFTLLANVHNPMTRTTNVLNSTLALYNHTLLERRESLTGYISVLENTATQFRVMRCDHSLLGGEWTMPPPKGQNPRVKEPIFAVFTMLEAIRLIDSDGGKPQLPDSEKQALSIGLGVGTAPTAMIAHGINITIIELDPVVHEFATTYFGLPSSHTSVIGDAVTIVESTVKAGLGSLYDYIIHDVFTGGAEPVELFTAEFLSGLNYLLKPDGVIAINYAGDLTLPAASYVVRTILAVFPSCRIYREHAPPLAKPDSANPNAVAPDFSNVVIFCKKTSSPITFRKPVAADYLGSALRKEFMVPKHELAITSENFQLEGEILMRGKTKQLEKWHVQSAIGHWKLMRGLLPDAVWENW